MKKVQKIKDKWYMNVEMYNGKVYVSKSVEALKNYDRDVFKKQFEFLRKCFEQKQQKIKKKAINDQKTEREIKAEKTENFMIDEQKEDDENVLENEVINVIDEDFEEAEIIPDQPKKGSKTPDDDTVIVESIKSPESVTPEYHEIESNKNVKTVTKNLKKQQSGSKTPPTPPLNSIESKIHVWGNIIEKQKSTKEPTEDKYIKDKTRRGSYDEGKRHSKYDDYSTKSYSQSKNRIKPISCSKRSRSLDSEKTKKSDKRYKHHD